MLKKYLIFLSLLIIIVSMPLSIGHSGNIYTINTGDSLFTIAYKFNTTINRLTRLNNLANPNLIYVNQRILVSEKETEPEEKYNNPVIDQPAEIYYGASRNKAQVALTFDDGPDRRFTPQILDILKEHNIKATFFLLGSQAEKNPDIVARIDAEGHIIANHTWSHPDLRKSSPQKIAREINRTEEEISSIIGKRTALMRPPYGFTTKDNLQQLARKNYQVIHWSVDSLDWKYKTKQRVITNVMNNMHPGANILLHSGSGENFNLQATVDALPEIIAQVKTEGMKFVTIDELFSIKPYK